MTPLQCELHTAIDDFRQYSVPERNCFRDCGREIGPRRLRETKRGCNLVPQLLGRSGCLRNGDTA